MVFLLEEIAVEAAMIIATLVAATCLLVVLAGFVLQRRAQRTAAPAASRAIRSASGTGRSARVASTFTPSHTDLIDIRHPMGDLAYIVLVLIGFVAVYSYARSATRL